jgi:ubiquinone/menaquinone biosynthesis C-methylase UbiE
MKDNFSRQARQYARFRPTYPETLYQFILALVHERKAAWDCGTGNGQVAINLATIFESVIATDISDDQIRNAPPKINIKYRIEPAERTSFADSIFDLVTVGQAVHWFAFDEFFSEVQRTLKPRGVIAVFGYQIPTVEPEIDAIISDFYLNILASFWDKERTYVNERYRTIPFPFDEIPAPTFNARYAWSVERFIGYVNTWSAVQHYIDRTKSHPVDKIAGNLARIWKTGEIKEVDFSIFARIGRNHGKQP